MVPIFSADAMIVEIISAGIWSGATGGATAESEKGVEAPVGPAPTDCGEGGGPFSGSWLPDAAEEERGGIGIAISVVLRQSCASWSVPA